MSMPQQPSQAVLTTAAFPVVRRYDCGQYYQSQMYANLTHPAQVNNLAMQHADFNDRNDSKPRLAKAEVELLERHFQENHKPPSSLKRQLAEGMAVPVSRINNWFQNRRAKAKHEKKLENIRIKREAAEGGVEASAPEDYDFSEDFPEMFDDEEETVPDESVQPSARSTPSSSETIQEETVLDDTPALKLETEVKMETIELGDFDFYNQVDISPFEAPFASSTGCDSAIFPSTATPASMPNMSGFQYDSFQLSVDAYSKDMMSTHLPPQQDFGFLPAIQPAPESTVPFPSRSLDDGQRRGSFQSSSNGLDQTGLMESVQEDQTMRFMSPPPASDIASRRSKRRPAPIGTAAIVDRSSSGVKTPLTAAIPRRTAKSPGTAIRRVVSVGNMNVLGARISKSAAQSPMRQHFPHELRKFSGMNGQVNYVQPGNGGLAPPTPKSPAYKFSADEQSRMLPATREHELESMGIFDASSPPFNRYGFQFSPPETPGYMSNGYAWSGFDGSDRTSYTPGLGAFPSDPFALQMAQPDLVPNYVSEANAFDIGQNSMHGTTIEAYHAQMQMAQQYMSPQSTEASISSLSTYNSSDLLHTKFEAQGVETSHQVQYQWEQQMSNFVTPALSTPELPSKSQTLVFHNATPKDFQGKKSPSSESSET